MNLIKNKFIYAFLIYTLLLSCSSDSPEPAPNPDPEPSITSITLSSNSSTIEEGESVTFLVRANTNQNVTSESTISIGGVQISGNQHTFESQGSYTVIATYNELTSNQTTITVNPPPASVTGISISASANSSRIGDTVNFSIEANMSDGTTESRTSQSTFYVNNTQISGNSFLNTQEGEIVVYATLDSFTSSEVIVQVNSVNTPNMYSKKAIIEDYTGTWCGWCPRVAYAIEQVEAQTEKVFAVAVHNGDSMANGFGATLEDEFNIEGFPTAWVNRAAEWTYPEPNNLDQAINEAQGNVNQGLAVNSLLTENNLSVVISTGFSQDFSGAKLVVFLLENEIVSSQSNYTSYYGGINPIPNFVHDHILRHSMTNVMGDEIDTGTGVKHIIYNLTTPSSVSNSNNMAILAFLVDSNGKNVINAQYAHVNSDQDFD